MLFFLELKYAISKTLLQMLICIQVPIHPSKRVPLVYLNFRKHRFISASKKITVPKMFANFPAKDSRWSLF